MRQNKKNFHSGESRNLILATARIFREAEHCNGRLSANAAPPQRFRLSPEWKIFNFAVYLFSIPAAPHFSIPAQAGISSRVSGNFREAEDQCRLSANAAVAAEIPAFAGMEVFFCRPAINCEARTKNPRLRLK